MNAPIDPAQQSLADALRVSFTILKLIMLVLVVFYLGSNIFNVPTQNTAVRLRFGEVVSDPLPPGGPHFAMPYPIEQVINIRTSPQTLSLSRQFWFEVTDADAGKTASELADSKQGPLNPERDGYLITGDSNIVHTKWQLTYRVEDARKYIEHVGDAAMAETLVRSAAEQAIVQAVAQLTADEFLKGITNEAAAQSITNRTLEELQTGIHVETLSVSQYTVPMSTMDAFQAVLNAESQKGQQIEAAQQERAKILGETAGEAHDALLQLVETYEIASETQDGQAGSLAELNAKLDAAFSSLTIGSMPIGGNVARTINEAQTYRTSIVEQVKAEAETFELLLGEYKRHPKIIESRLWQETREKVLSSPGVESFYVADGAVYLEMNRDPAVQRAREQQRLKEEQEQRRAQQQGR